jgi:hypothetical protein
MHFVCATHGHCFDGLASAAVFTRLLQELEPDAQLSYRACGYGPNQPKADAGLLTGQQNAILDYRYYDVPNLTWYFDHHRTAFASTEDEERFQRQQAGAPERYVFDPECTSCTKLIAQEAKQRHGLSFPELEPLVHWADVIDSARFPSAEAAADYANPVMQLVTVVEHYGDDKFLNKLVPALLQSPLEKIARSSPVQDKYKGLAPRHERFLERVRTRGRMSGRVVHVDLTEGTVDAVAKFATYALYPRAVYSVVVSLLSAAVKISVGYNPWSGVERDVDLSEICARWGGGGHPVVGGISFPKAELEKARTIALDIVRELAG